MRKMKKAVAITLASAMVVSSCMLATGCNKKPAGKVEKIEEDSPWYNVESYKITTQYDDLPNIEYIYTDVVGFFDGKIITKTNGYMSYPENAWDDPDFNYRDYEISSVDTYSLEGELVSSIDVSTALADEMADYESYYVQDITASDEGIKVTVDAWGLKSAMTEEEPSTDIEEDEEDGEESDVPEAMGASYVPSVKADPADEDADEDADTDEDVPEDIEDIDEDFGGGYEDDWEYGEFNDEYFKDHYFVAIFDVDTGDVISFEEIETSDDNEGSNEGTQLVGDGYSVTKYWLPESETYSYRLEITNADGEVTTVDLRDSFPDYSIYDIASFLTISDTEVIFKPSFDSDESNIFMKLNLATGDVTEEDSDFDWLPENVYYGSVKYLPGVGNVALTSSGIEVYDFDAQETRNIFDFNMCNINRYDASSLSLCDYSEERIVMAGSVYSSETGISYNSAPMVMVLTKAETNPNVGKTILTAASLDYLDSAVASAIVEFNETSSDYFVVYTDKYEIEVDYSNAEDESWLETQLAAQASLSNQLAIDLIAGDGPDIIFNAVDYRQLNDADYLLDLSDILDSTDGYFTNVIDAAKTGDKLYQLPLSFLVQGIKTETSNLSDGQVGFTFDQYSTFVDDVCNGTDPINLDQLDYFTSIIIGMNSEFEQDGDINYDCDAFREFAAYVKDNVPEKIDDNWDEYGVEVIPEYGFGETNTTEMSTVSSFANYVQWEAADGMSLVGLPSFDARGPIITCSYSVAVSAQTASPDGCKSFAQTLISENVQKIFARETCPISISAFEAIAQLALDEHNENMRKEMEYYTPAELEMYGIHEYDESIIDAFRETMAAASSMSSMDAAIQTILREEIPAYFSGQKSIDEVIDIIQDKVQTYINERG